ncbi:hypothetical protein F0344_16935 [Streptomyces finlayi]|uniref:Secreted protein n=1 Tax=Streptomyces finlayi TaxID=67296 RepID=A0A7G7BL65_9ACTN|nr:hypothetical protein [Streptomyces finlayi]QNE76080.1 hypothetical protein F0344_16935 [Streptomyces finlayi]
MRRQTFGPTGRRGTVIAASAAVLCLGGAVAACGGGAGSEGYVAVGAAGTGPAGTPGAAALPSDRVTLIPLDTPGAERGRGGDRAGGRTTGESGPADELPDALENAKGPRTDTTNPGDSGSSSGGSGGASGSGGSAPDAASPDPPAPADPSGSPAAGGTAGGGDPGSTGGSGGTGGTPPPSSGPAPAALQVGDPVHGDADRRWCEKVTVEFRNTGGSPVRSGTLTFETHIIGALGVDWATVESTQPLPTPIDAGAVRKKTYTVCVESWRVPLGMRTETQDVAASWR